MHGFWKAGLLSGLIGATAIPAAAVAQSPITQETQTAHYRLDLQIGPSEKMYTPAQVAAQHPTEGEVMDGGQMSMPKDMATAHHLEIQVHALDTGAVVTDATVTIAVSDASGSVQQVPVAKMYGIVQGVADTHYGNNVEMPPGKFTVDVTVNGEKAAFAVTVPAS